MSAGPFPCPKCGRSLLPAGELTVGDRTFPTYQCDECVVSREVLGLTMDVALTFCVNEHGQAFDPAGPDGSLLL
jgi:hypothetical protein